MKDRRIIETNPQAGASYFMANQTGRGANRMESFLHPKNEGDIRIILTGESAALGFPHAPPFTAGRFLQTMLQDIIPDRRVEVINLGTTAVASFPVFDMARKTLAYDPDLLIVYAGHNEFYGAFGVASRHFGYQSLMPTRALRWGQSLGLTQWALHAMRGSRETSRRMNTMELMIRDNCIEPNSVLRSRAERQIRYNLGSLVHLARKAKVPVLVCTAPVNERNLAPAGGTDPSLSIFKQASYEFSTGQTNEARAAFQRAIDQDTMPWRATSGIQSALHAVARLPGAMLCDLQEAFRRQSPGGCVGWELMVDHVHPSLQGQALVARTWLEGMTGPVGRLRVKSESLARLPDWNHYAAKQGSNIYEELAVALDMEHLFNSDFMTQSNPEARDRFRTRAIQLAALMPIELAHAIEHATSNRLYQGRTFSASGLAGAYWYAQKHFEEAAQLLSVARESAPPFGSERREAAYYMLDARARASGGLSREDRLILQDEIERGLVLLRYGASPSGKTQRFLGGLFQLSGDSLRSTEYHRQADEKGFAKLVTPRHVLNPDSIEPLHDR